MQFPQCNSCFEFEQREAVGLGQRGQHACEAVSVGVGLDDSQDLRAGGALPCNAKIGPQRGKIDLGQDRASHHNA